MSVFRDNMFIVASQVAMLYIMAAVGVVAERTGIFSESTAKKCTNVLFYIITPAKILESFFTLQYSTEAVKGLFIAIGVGLLMHSAAALCVNPLYRKSNPDKAVVYKYASIYGNCGYMGLPLVDAVLGSEGVFYCSAVIISFQIFTFTHGVWLINRDKEGSEVKIDLKKLILNPGVLPVFAGLPVFILSPEIPEVIMTPVSSIASMNTPLAMLIFGTYISRTDFRSVFRNFRIGGVALFKLVCMPLAVMGIIRLFGITGVLGSTIIIAASTPPANNTIMFAAKYDRDTGLASRTVAVVSLLAIITMPLVYAVSTLVVK